MKTRPSSIIISLTTTVICCAVLISCSSDSPASSGGGGGAALIDGDGVTAHATYAEEFVAAWNTRDDDKFRSYLCAPEILEAMDGGDVRNLSDISQYVDNWTPLYDLDTTYPPHVFDPNNSNKRYTSAGEKFGLTSAFQGKAEASTNRSERPTMVIIAHGVKLADGWCVNYISVS
ncbi:hypothetical protein GQ649_27710 [Rhodococcus sp. DSM 6344]|nr:hypothetical protein [Rhodococcus erythropolis]